MHHLGLTLGLTGKQIAGAKTREVLMSVVHTLVKRVADPESHGSRRRGRLS